MAWAKRRSSRLACVFVLAWRHAIAHFLDCQFISLLGEIERSHSGNLGLEIRNEKRSCQDNLLLYRKAGCLRSLCLSARAIVRDLEKKAVKKGADAHIMFALAACYCAMLLTRWCDVVAKEDGTRGQEINLQDSELSVMLCVIGICTKTSPQVGFVLLVMQPPATIWRTKDTGRKAACPFCMSCTKSVANQCILVALDVAKCPLKRLLYSAALPAQSSWDRSVVDIQTC